LGTVLPCHFINPDCPEVIEFEGHLETARKSGRKVPETLVMQPGQWEELHPIKPDGFDLY
jgi:hypothetical protein